MSEDTAVGAAAERYTGFVCTTVFDTGTNTLIVGSNLVLTDNRLREIEAAVLEKFGWMVVAQIFQGNEHRAVIVPVSLDVDRGEIQRWFNGDVPAMAG